MFNAILHIPVKILLSILGTLLTLNFATLLTKNFSQNDQPIVAEVIRVDHNHQHTLTIHLNQIHEERARIQALQGLLESEELRAEFEELNIHAERLTRERSERHRKILMIYR